MENMFVLFLNLYFKKVIQPNTFKCRNSKTSLDEIMEDESNSDHQGKLGRQYWRRDKNAI